VKDVAFWVVVTSSLIAVAYFLIAVTEWKRKADREVKRYLDQLEQEDHYEELLDWIEAHVESCKNCKFEGEPGDDFGFCAEANDVIENYVQTYIFR
jgi:hypothetical protein